ncbi:PREDICTED: probable tubulin polyglutamylase TTLL2, partial [Nicrophorus vespilloides]|uniref:Probable tubulin polyglutamylase TTLL2 n=1 Tax=Nicrophorus vespilloides TaxID=110193 RepID=A0ABM1MGV6_NICVS
ETNEPAQIVFVQTRDSFSYTYDLFNENWVCLERGWKEYNVDNSEHWNLWWRASGFPANYYKNLSASQFINHIPKGSSICRKDNLVRNLRCMKKIYGTIYDFSPHGFNLPLEYTKLAAECNRIRLISSGDELEGFYEDKPIWICKPVAQSQGRGIFLFRKLSELNYDTNTIVQKYIEKPLLIGGYKFDLRLYVCIPSYHPLTIYMYQEGLVRFGTDKFSLNDLSNPYRHLTNSSINKLGPGYAEMKDRIGSGCKWTLKQLRRYFQQAKIFDWLLWHKISALVVLTLLSHVSDVPQTTNCFDFFGFDVLIDDLLKPWLLEVNLSPALSYDCDADRAVKKPMLHDMFDLLGFPLYNTGLDVFNIFTDECKENYSNNQPQVGQAVGRWKKKQRKSGVKPKTSRANHRKDDKPVEKNSRNWGNDKNWCHPANQEGGWIRLCPIGESTNRFTYSNDRAAIKYNVAEVIKFTRIAKEVYKIHPQASECQLNEFLVNQMEITSDLWMPPI